MSYPPPPGTSGSSLPPRPPPSTVASSYARFAPRQVAAPPMAAAPHYGAPPTTSYAAPPMTTYSSAPTYPAYPTTSYGAAPSLYAPPVSTSPHIVNPFPAPSTRPQSRYNDTVDPELQAQIAQQQSIYDPSNAENLKARAAAPKLAAAEAAAAAHAASAVTIGPVGPSKPNHGSKTDSKEPTVIRQGGGQTWTDSSLLEWDPSHFRLFVGNLAGEVTDDSLLKAFAKYPSVKKARVIRDKRTTKSKGYGFVAFSDGDEYFRAAREMQGKYIGSHPVLLKRSNTEIKPVVLGGGKTKGGRVEKKKGKGKEKKKEGGWKVLG